MFNRSGIKFLKFVGVVILLGFQPPAFAKAQEIRVGHFPNVTHAPALIARARGYFEKEFGNEAAIQWKTFNAGPEAIEALFAGAIDFLYVGPSPAINGYVRSRGEALRVVAGTAAGGAGLVVRKDSGIEHFEDLKGKRIATPQKGNTQDVALSHLMKEKGLVPKDRGGDVEIFHIAGGDQIITFLKNQVDAIWTVEPWLTRLTSEAEGKILFEESELWPEGKYPTTALVVRKKFIDEKRSLVQKFVAAHVRLLDWMNGHEAQAKKLFNEEFARETGKGLPQDYLDNFFTRIEFTVDPLTAPFAESARHAEAVGYLGKHQSEISRLFDLSFLEEAQKGGKTS